MSQRGPTWGQLQANMDLKIIEKTLFFFSFFNILREALEASGNALEDSLGGPGVTLGTPWGALGKPWEALGAPWEALGTPWEALGTPWKTLLGRTFQKDLPGSTSAAKNANALR